MMDIGQGSASASRAVGVETREEPRSGAPARNALIHVVALTLTKLADALIDPKIVLAWLLNAVGAPGAVIGALVPVREAGSLLPQIWLARQLRSAPRRKYFWAMGSLGQGLAALCVAAAAFFVGGAAGGWLAVAALAAFAVFRAACSVSHKDALARTVAKGRRGRISGLAGSIGSGLALTVAAAFAVGAIPLEPGAVALAIAGAGALWLAAGAVFLRLDEPRGDSDPAATTPLQRQLAQIWRERRLRDFVLARALLTPSALAPPFLVLLASAESAGQGGLGALGPLMLASAAASILSAALWGRLSDRSSRRTLSLGGAVAALALAAAAVAGFATGGLGGVFGAAAAVFAAQFGYEGVRAGRKTHLTDMAPDAKRALWTALSNTAIGAVLIVGGAIGLVADLAGAPTALALCAGICALGAAAALRLEEVQQDGAGERAP